MTDGLTNNTSQGQPVADGLKGWGMFALTLIFIILYGAALAGWLRPLPDEKMVLRLEPIIFVIVGYYFGRMPAQQNEKTLKGEIRRLTQKADAVQHAKEQAQQSREALEEKIKNVRAALQTAQPGAHGAAAARAGDEALRNSMFVALEVLKS